MVYLFYWRSIYPLIIEHLPLTSSAIVLKAKAPKNHLSKTVTKCIIGKLLTIIRQRFDIDLIAAKRTMTVSKYINVIKFLLLNHLFD